MRRTAVAPLVVFLLTVLVLLPDLGGQNVWSKDEARDGLVVRDMVEEGHWLIPHSGGRLYPYKPPLFHWLVGLLSLRGVNEWTLRLPSVLAAGATTAVTYSIAARIATPAMGLVAAAVLASSATFVEWARTGRLEMLFVLWITLGFWSVVRRLDGGGRRHAVVLGLALGLGCLTKGPLGLVPLVALLIALGLLRRWSASMLADVGLACAVALVLPAAWLGAAAAVRAGVGEYLEAVTPIIGYEAQARRARWALYPLEAIGAGFLPWSLVLPGALWVVARSWKRAWPALCLPLLWMGLVLVVFTVFVSPRAVHFLPMYPALALIVAWAWTACSLGARRWLATPIAVLVGALVVGGLILALFPVSLETGKRVLELGRGVGLALAGIGAATAVASLWLATLRRPHGALVVAGMGALLALMVLHIGVYTPRANRAYPTRAAAERLARALPAGAEVAYLDRKFVTGLMFYLPRRPVEVGEVGELRALADRPGLHALVPFGEMLFINGGVCLPTRPLREERVFGDRYILVDFRGTPARWCLWPPGS